MYFLFKQIILLLGIIILTSCAAMKPVKIHVVNQERRIKQVEAWRKEDRMIKCFTNLYKQGFSQKYIKEYCETAFRD